MHCSVFVTESLVLGYWSFLTLTAWHTFMPSFSLCACSTFYIIILHYFILSFPCPAGLLVSVPVWLTSRLQFPPWSPPPMFLINPLLTCSLLPKEHPPEEDLGTFFTLGWKEKVSDVFWLWLITCLLIILSNGVLRRELNLLSEILHPGF